MTSRRSRGTRPRAGKHQLTPRDTEILFAVGRMAQATSDQLRRLFFCDPSTTSRRLSKLASLRLLDVHVCAQTEPNIYTLSKKGIELLTSTGVAATDELHKSRVGQRLDLHLQLLNDLRVEFALATRSRTDVVLESFHADLDLRRAAGSPPPSYIPDAIVELVMLNGTKLALIAEIDTGSEGRSVFSSKVQGTVALWRGGRKCWGAGAGTWRPAVFVPSAGRARALARCAVELGGGALWLLAEFGRLREVGALGPVFATADEVVTAPARQPIAYGGALVSAAREAPP